MLLDVFILENGFDIGKVLIGFSSWFYLLLYSFTYIGQLVVAMVQSGSIFGVQNDIKVDDGQNVS